MEYESQMTYLDDRPQEVKNASYYHRQVKALEAENLRLQTALQKVVNWNCFPSTGRFYGEPANTRPMSYGACYGSNGERDYMRNLAKKALLTSTTDKG